MSTVPESTNGVKTIHWRWYLEINGSLYELEVLEGGYRLHKPDLTFYDIDRLTWICDCPDATYRPRPGGCKHVRALREGLASLGL